MLSGLRPHTLQNSVNAELQARRHDSIVRVTRTTAATVSGSPPLPYSLPSWRLILHCVVQFFSGVHHVLMRFLNRIELLLLISRKHRPDLRQRALDHGLCFLHRLLMNGDQLRFGLIKDRLELRLLVSCQIQFLGDPPKAERVAMPASTPAVARLRLHYNKAAERDRTDGNNC
jgi:hypothetical protein